MHCQHPKCHFYLFEGGCSKGNSRSIATIPAALVQKHLYFHSAKSKEYESPKLIGFPIRVSNPFLPLPVKNFQECQLSPIVSLAPSPGDSILSAAYDNVSST